MNTKILQDNIKFTTIGSILRQARENIGLSQQDVANRLCLKLSTVQNIEEDYKDIHLASTFFRGYIRSYARLVHVTEEELIPMIEEKAPIKSYQVTLTQHYSLDDFYKKHDNFFMRFFWIFLFIMIGTIGVFWWKNDQSYQKNITNINNHRHFIKLSKHGNNENNLVDHIQSKQMNEFDTKINTSNAKKQIVKDMHSFEYDKYVNEKIKNSLVIKFISDCWLKVTDAQGVIIYNGTQHSGEQLNLIGESPYQIKTNTPNALQIKYQGKPVDLSQGITSNQNIILTVSDN